MVNADFLNKVVSVGPYLWIVLFCDQLMGVLSNAVLWFHHCRGFVSGFCLYHLLNEVLNFMSNKLFVLNVPTLICLIVYRNWHGFETQWKKLLELRHISSVFCSCMVWLHGPSAFGNLSFFIICLLSAFTGWPNFIEIFYLTSVIYQWLKKMHCMTFY